MTHLFFLSFFSWHFSPFSNSSSLSNLILTFWWISFHIELKVVSQGCMFFWNGFLQRFEVCTQNANLYVATMRSPSHFTVTNNNKNLTLPFFHIIWEIFSFICIARTFLCCWAKIRLLKTKSAVSISNMYSGVHSTVSPNFPAELVFFFFDSALLHPLIKPCGRNTPQILHQTLELVLQRSFLTGF